MFEVITSEASYLQSLGVLVDHFMDDPGMNPGLPEGRRILDKRQHHVIFSNIKEVQEVSERLVYNNVCIKVGVICYDNLALQNYFYNLLLL